MILINPRFGTERIRPLTIRRKSDKHGRVTLPKGWENKHFEVYFIEFENRKGLLLVETGLGGEDVEDVEY